MCASCVGRRLGAVEAPHDHRHVTDLALGDPADVVLVEPRRDPRRLAEVAVVDLRELGTSADSAPTATSCGASTSRRTSCALAGDHDVLTLRTCDTVPDPLALRVVDADLRAHVAPRVERRAPRRAPCTAHMSRSSSTLDPRLVVVRHHDHPGVARRRSRGASASGIAAPRVEHALGRGRRGRRRACTPRRSARARPTRPASPTRGSW